MRERLPAPGGATYSDAVTVETEGTRVVYLAGQTARERGGSLVPADLAGQTERCFEQIEALLGRHGATLQDVVQITTYLTDLSRYSEFAAVRGRVFGDSPPTSAVIGGAELLGGALVEIVAVAVVG
jgi:2-iminobutanoate/2-iminopropanoate deaminase